jgi:hypothetical protein
MHVAKLLLRGSFDQLVRHAPDGEAELLELRSQAELGNERLVTILAKTRGGS